MLQNQVYQLYDNQLKNWDTFRENVNNLRTLKTRIVNINGTKITLQFNPKRIVSSGSKIDKKSLSERPCFLCKKNRPEVQERVIFNQDFEILVNPYPIIPYHFTIPKINHEDQQILPNIGTMIDLALELEDFNIFYNGPQCGASAPDHMHFQAVKKSILPLENDIKNIHNSFNKADYLRSCIFIKDNDKKMIINTFNNIYDQFKTEECEPKMNIFCWSEQKEITICIFPRKAHRPSYYFEKGEKQILVSPGAIDMAGILILPQEKDFNNITEKIIQDIYTQVSAEI